jgi:hypothetical protein
MSRIQAACIRDFVSFAPHLSPGTHFSKPKGGNHSSCIGFYSLDVDANAFCGQVTASFSTTLKPPQVGEQAAAKLDEMVEGLGPVDYADIEIELFPVEIDGGIFGLVDGST